MLITGACSKCAKSRYRHNDMRSYELTGVLLMSLRNYSSGVYVTAP